MANTWILEVTDPADPTIVHTFTGDTEADVDAQADSALGIDAADQHLEP
ncbi:hypothetical protein FIV07_27850 (plasmid) [Mycobacterium sp. THAF192]|nr:hypothetical protein FIV07_27850 [Mycobacterium sp. THAF192]